MKKSISNLLEMLRVQSSAYVAKNVIDDWSMQIGEHVPMCRFHLVVAGEAWVEVPEDGAREHLMQGDLAIVSHGRAHILSDRPGTSPITAFAVPMRGIPPEYDRYDRESPNVHILCGFFRLAPGAPPVVMDRLPSILVSRQSSSEAHGKIGGVYELLQRELEQPGGPSQLVLDRLTELICVFAIGRWLESRMESGNEADALADRRIHQVLERIHADPAADWTVGKLAEVFGQSRSSFAIRFKSVIGMSPMEYVSHQRIALARRYLSESDMLLDAVAARTGFSDTNAFGRAFKRVAGCAPGAFRREAQK